MKKFMFSAVALVAFSFSGLASDIEEKKIEIETYLDFFQIDEMETSEVISSDLANCFDYAIIVYHGTIKRGKDPEYAIELAEWAFNDCMEWDNN